jgi:hypothetical protein
MTNLSLSTGCCDQQTLGADPLYFKWNVVRGDTSSIVFQFLENDEVTELDMSDWTFVATAFNNKNQQSYDLDVALTGGQVEVTATSDVTATWGNGISQSAVAELNFDLQATNLDGTVWTPVIGTIVVIGDVTGGTL